LPASASPAANQYALQSFCRSRIFQRTANSVLTVCVSLGGKRNATLHVGTARCEREISLSLKSPEKAGRFEDRVGMPYQ